MSQQALDKFLTSGAEAVGGVLYLNRVAVGKFEAEGFVLTEAGQATAQQLEPAVAPVDIAEKAAEPTGRKGRSGRPAVQEDLVAQNSDILAGLGE